MHRQKVITMRAHNSVGRVYRRCGCRDEQRHQLGTQCPRLTTEPAHGTWTFAVDLPATEPGGHNHTVRRGGFPTQDEARSALHRYLTGRRVGISADPNQTVADYLAEWLKAKQLRLKPTTWVRYRDYVEKDLIPALGTVRLDDLAYEHLLHFVQSQLAAGRGRPTVWHILATLSSALGEAVRTHRLPANVARPTIIPRPRADERAIWTPAQAVRFLRYCRTHDPDFADLIELIICTGLRKGEALALHWDDIHLDQGLLYVRWTLSAIDNNKLVMTAPKTAKSREWVALSRRTHKMLARRKAENNRAGKNGNGLVFQKDDGRPLHPQYVLNHFHYLARKARLPRCNVHDLRHLAITIAISEGVDMVIVSKTARHSTLSTTANIYAHLTRKAARRAVDAIARALDREEKQYDHTTTTRPAASKPAARKSRYGKAA
ncbi:MULTISPECIES: tyrosine-type recombinase/integrase [unclassified Kitasatospora]|uniref:tyrosine-type recombinase/integrase n=1 Tax=unclassified Kitasatospora TaxID=2633591 RepID=UPI0007C8819F|nr:MULTISPECIES: tyrosine-type recombinase/integrase [unclassified Kitasatospora]